MELDFDTSLNEQEYTLNDVQREIYENPHKEQETSFKASQNANKEVRKINELMIQYNISEKKRKEFLLSSFLVLVWIVFVLTSHTYN